MFEKWMNSPKIKEEHHEFAIRNEIHSEMNAMIFAAKNGISTNGADVLYSLVTMYKLFKSSSPSWY